MADVIADVLGRPVTYRQTNREDSVSRTTAVGASEQTIRDMTDMYDAQNDGIYQPPLGGGDSKEDVISHLVRGVCPVRGLRPR